MYTKKSSRCAKRLDGAVAVVTGAASGIGHALAHELHARGARLALIDSDGERLTEVTRTLGALALPLDVRDGAALADAAARVDRELGTPDLLFLNAGVAAVGPALDAPLDDVRWVFDVNVLGVLLGAQAFVPAMVSRGRGRVGVTASIAGLLPMPGMPVYGASKHALVGLAASMRIELAKTGVTVTTICPGQVRTGLHRATRYRNNGFRDLLERAPVRALGGDADHVARRALDATWEGAPTAVIGPERAFVWLHRWAPSAYLRVAATAARALGLIGNERAP
jgi:NADP-dependent 3-hydroxy acid dehydrogenase YdfG